MQGNVASLISRLEPVLLQLFAVPSAFAPRSLSSCLREGIGCGSAAVSERSECTAQGYRRFRCRACGKQSNERSAGVLNRTQYPSDIIALVVLWRLRYQLALRDLLEMFLIRGIFFSHEAARDWEAKLTPALAEGLRRRRRGKIGKSWYADEISLRGTGHWPHV